MELRQYRQTWVKGTIGLGSVAETKAAQEVRTSGGKLDCSQVVVSSSKKVFHAELL